MRWWFAACLVLASTAEAGRRDWTGSAACGACHAKEYAAWQQTPHGRARQTAPLPPRCNACHGVGEAPAGPVVESVVGCEACHGAGAAYAPDDVMRDKPLAIALGLADLATKPRATLCATCHTVQLGPKPFDPTAKVH